MNHFSVYKDYNTVIEFSSAQLNNLNNDYVDRWHKPCLPSAVNLIQFFCQESASHYRRVLSLLFYYFYFQDNRTTCTLKQRTVKYRGTTFRVSSEG